ncbi:MAG: glycosyltransferase family 2 protein [bacterium]|nr:glycosyltransferase family 2 protein [bacterium]
MSEAKDLKSASGSPHPLAVVVVNWNGRQDLPDCFRSLGDDRFLQLRVIMVDNGSEDDSVAWTREHYPEVEIIETGENLRWAGGNNVALKMLKEEKYTGHILLLNNDTVVPEGSLRRLADALEDSPEAWAVTPRICYAHNPALIWYDGGLVGKFSGWVRHAGLRKMAGKLDYNRRFIDYGTGCALMIRSEVLDRVGLLDDGYYFYGEDADYSLRITSAGGRIMHVPRAVILHKVSATLGSDSPRKAWLRSRSHMRLLGKHWPRAFWPVLFFTQLGFLGGHSSWHLWNGRLETAIAIWQGAVDEMCGRGY